jgi:ligand-binding sensor domain-containing protein
LLPFGLIQNAAYALLDEDSLLWVSGPMLNSRRTGITGYDRGKNVYRYVETGIQPDLPAVNINCLAGNLKYLAVGTETGLFLIERATQQVARRIDRRRGFADDNITSLQTVGEDTIFIGTTGGLLVYDISGDSIGFIAQRQFFNTIIYKLALSEGYLWVGSNVGAFRLSLGTGKLQKYQDPDLVLFNRVFDIRVFDHYIWFASDNGLVRLDLNDGTTTPYRVSSRKLDSRVMDVNDTIAAVSSETGITLIFLAKDGLQTRDFSVADGLASTYVYGLQLDGDYLWIGTDKGLTRFLWNNPDRVD